MLRSVLALSLLTVSVTPTAEAETGYDLWLRYAPIADEGQRAVYARTLKSLVVESHSPTAEVTRAELERGLGKLLGAPLLIAPAVRADGALKAWRGRWTPSAIEPSPPSSAGRRMRLGPGGRSVWIIFAEPWKTA